MPTNALLPVLPACCGTCPFRYDSPYHDLVPSLVASALTLRESRICHSTGEGNSINHYTGRPAKLCRGARDIQLQWLVKLGYLPEPTDAAYRQVCLDMGIPAPPEP